MADDTRYNLCRESDLQRLRAKLGWDLLREAEAVGEVTAGRRGEFSRRASDALRELSTESVREGRCDFSTLEEIRAQMRKRDEKAITEPGSTS